jgi:hypothetical protein
MRGYPSSGVCGVTAVVVAPDKAEVKADGKTGQGVAEYVHFDIGGAGDKKKTNKAKHGHHQPDNHVTYVAFHLHLSCAAGRSVMELTRINIDSYQCFTAQ